MQLVIDIPEKEFGIDIEDKFQDFFSRLKVETKEHLIINTSLVCGAYELETIDMFLKAFNNGIPLPKMFEEIKADIQKARNSVNAGNEEFFIGVLWGIDTISEIIDKRIGKE